MCNPEACDEVKPTPNFPNPFEALTSIKFYTKEADYGILSVFDIKGNKIDTQTWNVSTPGYHILNWEGRGQSSGIYIYNIESYYGILITGKMVLIK